MRTKIIATIGPASSSKNVLERLVQAGVRIFRLNFSHGDVSFFEQLVSDIRALEQECNQPLTIMQDLSGPKIRIGVLEGNALDVHRGDHLLLGSKHSKLYNLPFLPFENETVLAGIEQEDLLVLADGGLQFQVVAKAGEGLFELEALGTGIVTSRKGLALPGKSLPLPALTEKDKKDLQVGLRLGVDAVAMSFVQSAEDVRELKHLLHAAGRPIPVVAKLERKNAVDRLDDILKETDIVMVARGDLGVECPLPELPGMQKRIIRACNKASKPVIVATQMLLSMVNNPAPTRAETTDVANAVLDGADCVMLSEETAMGTYPVETVAYMRRITAEAEALMVEGRQLPQPSSDSGASEFLAYTACLLAEKTKATALACHSLSGSSARLLSSCRPWQLIHVLTPDSKVLHNLNFSWGVQPHPVQEDPAVGHLDRVQHFVATTVDFPRGMDIVITAGEPSPGGTHRGTNVVKIYRK